MSQRAVAQAVVQDIEERARRAKPPGLEQLCRYLLVADTYSVLVPHPPLSQSLFGPDVGMQATSSRRAGLFIRLTLAAAPSLLVL